MEETELKPRVYPGRLIFLEFVTLTGFQVTLRSLQIFAYVIKVYDL